MANLEVILEKSNSRTTHYSTYARIRVDEVREEVIINIKISTKNGK